MIALRASFDGAPEVVDVSFLTSPTRIILEIKEIPALESLITEIFIKKKELKVKNYI